MKIEQTLEVPWPIDDVWDYFHDRVEQVVRCVPGVETFEDLGEDTYRVRMTQRIGTVYATFDLKARLESEELHDHVVFSANGRTVKGASGTLQSRNRVDFTSTADGGTAMTVTADVVVGGVMGSMGHRVIGPKASQVTAEFARAITAEMSNAS